MSAAAAAAADRVVPSTSGRRYRARLSATPASVVTVPLVPSTCTPPRPASRPMQCTRSNAASGPLTSATIASNPAAVNPAAPCRSASVTTPSGRLA